MSKLTPAQQLLIAIGCDDMTVRLGHSGKRRLPTSTKRGPGRKHRAGHPGKQRIRAGQPDELIKLDFIQPTSESPMLCQLTPGGRELLASLP